MKALVNTCIQLEHVVVVLHFLKGNSSFSSRTYVGRMPSESAKKRQAQKRERDRQRQKQASAKKNQKAEQVAANGGANGGSEGACASAEEVKSKVVDKKTAARSCTG